MRLKLKNRWKYTHKNPAQSHVHEEPLMKVVVDRFPKQYISEKKYRIQLYENPDEGLNRRELRIFTDRSNVGYRHRGTFWRPQH